MTENERLWIGIALLAVAILIACVALARHRAQTRRAMLKRQFGPEYDRAVEEIGDPARAERELEARARRVEHFRFKDLGPSERARFAQEWHQIQTRFVDDPAVAVSSANELINQVMRARGYPTLSFDQRVADLSVEHPTVVQHYRAAHTLSGSIHNGTVDTELLRQALVHYRILFTELLQDNHVSAPPAPLRRAHA
jgi:hypothetical protein